MELEVVWVTSRYSTLVAPEKEELAKRILRRVQELVEREIVVQRTRDQQRDSIAQVGPGNRLTLLAKEERAGRESSGLSMRSEAQ